ncbi:prephenate dehydratase [Pelistega sp. NLN82]|uniref:Bifunctional chorismate mutase/prephenate dehydratase n=1 Tax=Pelistega ratti TaxID=2652177 RepID=A0A6L9Y5V5_9BURK|nr:prephenate dehydratase [Pelistega ratti]NEN75779.1 prephenate dehydratase [Pelistega ratti]
MDNKQKQLQAELLPLRQRIDEIDEQLLALLNERAQVAVTVGEVKHSFGERDTILKPEREAQIIRRLQALNTRKIFPESSVQAVWSEIISACRGLERGLVVAYLGPEGSFSEQAALSYYGHAIQKMPCESFDEVFHVVETGRANVGMVPIENSTEGAVNRTQDLLLSSTVKVHGERTLPISHCLLHKTGDLSQVTRLLGHPQALAQCHHWITRNYPHLERVPAASNSEAARLASEDPTCVAIAGMQAAMLYGLTVVVEGIQDDANNKTRFLAIGKIDVLPSGNDQTSLIFAVPNRAGAVYDMISPFARHQVSMRRFESRPARTGQWEYYFYVDILGHYLDEPVAKALEELKEQSSFFKLLGSYPMQ